MVGDAFVTATIDFSVLFAPSPFIKSFRDFTWFSLCRSATLFFPAPPKGFTKEAALTLRAKSEGKIISVFKI